MRNAKPQPATVRSSLRLALATLLLLGLALAAAQPAIALLDGPNQDVVRYNETEERLARAGDDASDTVLTLGELFRDYIVDIAEGNEACLVRQNLVDARAGYFDLNSDPRTLANGSRMVHNLGASWLLLFGATDDEATVLSSLSVPRSSGGIRMRATVTAPAGVQARLIDAATGAVIATIDGDPARVSDQIVAAVPGQYRVTETLSAGHRATAKATVADRAEREATLRAITANTDHDSPDFDRVLFFDRVLDEVAATTGCLTR